MTVIRAYQPGVDDAALDAVCVQTADAGLDATGLLADDDIWPDIFLRPYLSRHPDLAWVVDGETGPVGYIVATSDTAGFERWFRSQWWSQRAPRWHSLTRTAAPGDASRQSEILGYADRRGTALAPYVDRYPAHLHIDLLPVAQGQGWGRRLIETLVSALRSREVAGLHLVADAANTGAVAFYKRLGFTPLHSSPGSAAFGLSVTGPDPAGRQ